MPLRLHLGAHTTFKAECTDQNRLAQTCHIRNRPEGDITSRPEVSLRKSLMNNLPEKASKVFSSIRGLQKVDIDGMMIRKWKPDTVPGKTP